MCATVGGALTPAAGGAAPAHLETLPGIIPYCQYRVSMPVIAAHHIRAALHLLTAARRPSPGREEAAIQQLQGVVAELQHQVAWYQAKGSQPAAAGSNPDEWLLDEVRHEGQMFLLDAATNKVFSFATAGQQPRPVGAPSLRSSNQHALAARAGSALPPLARRFMHDHVSLGCLLPCCKCASARNWKHQAWLRQRTG
jgi:hypothetical protein